MLDRNCKGKLEKADLLHLIILISYPHTKTKHSNNDQPLSYRALPNLLVCLVTVSYFDATFEEANHVLILKLKHLLKYICSTVYDWIVKKDSLCDLLLAKQNCSLFISLGTARWHLLS